MARGCTNKVIGDTNAVTGSSNKVIGSTNTVIGSQNAATSNNKNDTTHIVTHTHTHTHHTARACACLSASARVHMIYAYTHIRIYTSYSKGLLALVRRRRISLYQRTQAAKLPLALAPPAILLPPPRLCFLVVERLGHVGQL